MADSPDTPTREPMESVEHLTAPTDDFYKSFDARVWTKAWLKTIAEHPDIPTDEGTMIGWFANALMRGYDEHAWRTPAVPEKPQEAVAWYVGVAKHPEDFGGFPRPEKVDVARGVWSFKGPTWICDCTDFQTANDMVEGHNRQLLSAASPLLDAGRRAEVEAAADEYADFRRCLGWDHLDTLAAKERLLALLGPAGGAANESDAAKSEERARWEPQVMQAIERLWGGNVPVCGSTLTQAVDHALSVGVPANG